MYSFQNELLRQQQSLSLFIGNISVHVSSSIENRANLQITTNDE